MIVAGADFEGYDLGAAWQDSKLGLLGSAVQQVSNSVALLVEEELVSTRVAKRVVGVLLDNMGVEYDPDEDQALLDDEKEDREKKAAEAFGKQLDLMKAKREEPGGDEEKPTPPQEQVPNAGAGAAA